MTCLLKAVTNRKAIKNHYSVHDVIATIIGDQLDSTVYDKSDVPDAENNGHCRHYVYCDDDWCMGIRVNNKCKTKL